MLTDVVLPGAMNGPKLAAEVRRRHPSIGCIFMTGYAEDAFNNHGFPGNGAIIIQKPFRKFNFATAIRSALDEAQKGDEHQGLCRSPCIANPDAVLLESVDPKGSQQMRGGDG